MGAGGPSGVAPIASRTASMVVSGARRRSPQASTNSACTPQASASTGRAIRGTVAVAPLTLYTFGPMSRWLVERRLSDVSARLKRLRADLQVIDEQLLFLADAADETRLRALMSETPLADRDHHEAQKHADAMARERANVIASIAEQEKAQDELLDKLVAETR